MTVIDSKRLREAVESAPDYAAAQAEANRLYTLKQQADDAYSTATKQIEAIWDREAERLFGIPDRLSRKNG